MKKAILLLFCGYILISASAQNNLPASQIDSLKRLLTTEKIDSNLFELHMQLGIAHQFVNPHYAIQELSEGVKFARKMKDKQRMFGSLVTLGYAYTTIGEYVKSLEANLEALRLAEELDGAVGMALAFIGENHEALGDFKNALDYQRMSFIDYEKNMKKKRTDMDPRG